MCLHTRFRWKNVTPTSRITSWAYAKDYSSTLENLCSSACPWSANSGDFCLDTLFPPYERPGSQQLHFSASPSSVTAYWLGSSVGMYSSCHYRSRWNFKCCNVNYYKSAQVKRFVKHAQVSGLCSSRNCARLCCHKTMFSSWVPTSYPMLGYVILRSLSLPRRDVPFIPYLTGTRILKLTSLVHPGYENYLVFQCSGNSTIATYLHMCWSSFA